MEPFICGDCMHILNLRISSKVTTDSKCPRGTCSLPLIYSLYKVDDNSILQWSEIHWEVSHDASIQTPIQPVTQHAWLCFRCIRKSNTVRLPSTRTASSPLHCRSLSSLALLLPVTHPAVSDHEKAQVRSSLGLRISFGCPSHSQEEGNVEPRSADCYRLAPGHPWPPCAFLLHPDQLLSSLITMTTSLLLRDSNEVLPSGPLRALFPLALQHCLLNDGTAFVLSSFGTVFQPSCSERNSDIPQPLVLGFVVIASPAPLLSKIIC